MSSTVHLRRLDPDRNVKRFYDLRLQTDLFGDTLLVVEWGRLGQAGARRSSRYPTEHEAVTALDRKRRAKERRGYWPIRTEE